MHEYARGRRVERRQSWKLTMTVLRSQVESPFTGPLFLPDQESNGRTGKPIRLTDLILQKTKIRLGDVLRMADKQRKNRGLHRDLRHERRFSDLLRLSLSGRQRMHLEN